MSLEHLLTNQFLFYLTIFKSFFETVFVPFKREMYAILGNLSCHILDKLNEVFYDGIRTKMSIKSFVKMTGYVGYPKYIVDNGLLHNTCHHQRLKSEQQEVCGHFNNVF